MCSADFPGRSTLKTDAVLIFDLDDTILSVNSFPHWARYMLTGYFGGLKPRQRLALSLSTAAVLFDRKVLKCSHFHAKRQLKALWLNAIRKDKARAALYGFCSRLQRHVRPNMQTLLRLVAARRFDAILATSAAGEYAKALGEALGFTHVLASDGVENSGEQKCSRVMETIDALGWADRQRIFFTDHKEDMPLIRQCHRVFWFGIHKEAADIQAVSPWEEIIACCDRPGMEIMQLVTEGRQASPDKSTAIRPYG